MSFNSDVADGNAFWARQRRLAERTVIMEELWEAWEKAPYMRLAQIIANVAEPEPPTVGVKNHCIFALSDEDFIKRLKDYNGKLSTGAQPPANS